MAGERAAAAGAAVAHGAHSSGAQHTAPPACRQEADAPPPALVMFTRLAGHAGDAGGRARPPLRQHDTATWSVSAAPCLLGQSAAPARARRTHRHQPPWPPPAQRPLASKVMMPLLQCWLRQRIPRCAPARAAVPPPAAPAVLAHAKSNRPASAADDEHTGNAELASPRRSARAAAPRCLTRSTRGSCCTRRRHGSHAATASPAAFVAVGGAAAATPRAWFDARC